MEFCDNILQLLQGYFRDFSVERLEKPWKAFTASWSRNIIARNLGESRLKNSLLQVFILFLSAVFWSDLRNFKLKLQHAVILLTKVGNGFLIDFLK